MLRRVSALLIMMGLVAVSAQTLFSAEVAQTYRIQPMDEDAPRGVVTLKAYSAGTVIVISLTRIGAQGSYPAHFHSGDCGSGGDVTMPLENVDGSTRLSISFVDTPLDVILGENYYLNVHASEADMATIVACTEIGSDEQLAGSSSTTTEASSGQTTIAVRPEEFETLSTAG